jgi:beta-lactamase regulating signal transducer with metallopeptidase domain
MSLPLAHLLETFARAGMGAVLNALWQGAVLAIAVWCIMRLLPRASATARYTVWFGTLAAVLTLPLLALASGGARDLVQNLPPLALPETWARIIFAAWYVVATGLIARLLWNYVRLEQIKASATPLEPLQQHRIRRWLEASGGKRSARLCSSEQIPMPVAIGLRDPIIVIPRYLLEHLSDTELDQVGLHEMAHLQRWDDITNVAQKIAEALCFFNPVVHWVGRQLSLEREIACDDAVVAATGKPVTYAACLTRLAETATLLQHGLPAVGVLAPRKQIAIRVERLLDRNRRSLPGFSRFLGIAAAAAIALVIVVASQFAPVVAVSATPDASSASRTAETASTRIAAAGYSAALPSHRVAYAKANPAQFAGMLALKIETFKLIASERAGHSMHFILHVTRHAFGKLPILALRNAIGARRLIVALPASAPLAGSALTVVAMTKAPATIATDATGDTPTAADVAAYSIADASSAQLDAELSSSTSVADRMRIVAELADRSDDAIARDALAKALAADVNGRVQVEAARALADRADDSAARAALAAALRASTSASVQAIALNALEAYLDDAAVRSAVLEALRSENLKIRKAAAASLAPYAEEDAAVKAALDALSAANAACVQSAKAVKASNTSVEQARKALDAARKALEEESRTIKNIDVPGN